MMVPYIWHSKQGLASLSAPVSQTRLLGKGPLCFANTGAVDMVARQACLADDQTRTIRRVGTGRGVLAGAF
jgi:hypothetical protein